MVKHQRRSHQRGLHPHEILDDCTSDSDSGESPTTPKHSSIQWPIPNVLGTAQPSMSQHSLHRAASFADFGQQMNTYPMSQYSHRHSVSNSTHDITGQHIHDSHTGVLMLHRTSTMPQQPHSYYVTEQSNPGVATMNTNPPPTQYHMPRQPVERLPLEIPYSAPGMTHSIQSSPSSFSADSGRSPSTQEGFYTHQPTQAATYALHTASPVEPQQQMVQYPPQISHQPLDSSQQPMHNQVSHDSPAPPTTEQFHPAPPRSDSEAWYSGVAYQSPVVEVNTIGQIPTYGSAVYVPWEPKIEFEDLSMQLPSARIATM
jgi:hypothetical protein